MVPSKLLPIQYFHEQTTHRDGVSFHQAIPFEGLIPLPYISTQYKLSDLFTKAVIGKPPMLFLLTN